MANSKIVCIFAPSNKKGKIQTIFVMDIEKVISELEERKLHHGLDCVEITEEDAELVIERVNGGMYLEDAVNEVLEAIKECLC